jgi:hypothetical protein
MPFSYYQQRKHLLKERCLEAKRRSQELRELFKDYGGEAHYYRRVYAEFCALKY